MAIITSALATHGPIKIHGQIKFSLHMVMKSFMVHMVFRKRLNVQAYFKKTVKIKIKHVKTAFYLNKNLSI